MLRDPLVGNIFEHNGQAVLPGTLVSDCAAFTPGGGVAFMPIYLEGVVVTDNQIVYLAGVLDYHGKPLTVQLRSASEAVTPPPVGVIQTTFGFDVCDTGRGGGGTTHFASAGDAANFINSNYAGTETLVIVFTKPQPSFTGEQSLLIQETVAYLNGSSSVVPPSVLANGAVPDLQVAMLASIFLQEIGK